MHIDTQGMTTLLNKLFGAKGMKTLSGTLGKILKSNPLKMDPKQFISDIVSGVSILYNFEHCSKFDKQTLSR